METVAEALRRYAKYREKRRDMIDEAFALLLALPPIAEDDSWVRQSASKPPIV